MRKLRRVVAAAAIVLMGAVIALCFWTPSRSDLRSTPGPVAQALVFPKGFLWGAAISGHQAESRQDSDWTAFERDAIANQRFASKSEFGTTQPGSIRDFGAWSEEVRVRKSDFDRRFEGDIEAAAAMGLNSLRVSVEWARLFPRADMQAADPAGMKYYSRLFASMKAHGIEPIVTLYHYVSPRWLFERDSGGKRGWERADAQEHWQRFVTSVAQAFVGDVRYWCTLNEPMVLLYNGYIEGSYPPLEHRADLPAVADVYEGLLRAHAAAYGILHEVARQKKAQVQVGLTQAVEYFAPDRNYAPADRITDWIVDQGWNWDFLDAVQSGRLRIVASDVDREIPGLRGTMDYVGLNYYMRILVRGDLFHPDRPLILMRDENDSREQESDMGWPIVPRGLYVLLAQSWKRYGKPILILENGDADARQNDTQRQEYIKAHVRETWLAMHDAGADVRAYVVWSLLDNFEWTDGFGPRFGLIAVDYNHDFARTPRDSTRTLAAITTSNSLPANLNDVAFP
jgi:beta-glucosidase